MNTTSNLLEHESADNASSSWSNLVRLRLANGITLNQDQGEYWLLSDGSAHRKFRVPGEELPCCFRALQDGGLRFNQVVWSDLRALSPASQLSRLWGYGLLVQELLFGDEVAATFGGRTGGPLLPPNFDPQRPITFRSDAYLRPDVKSLVVESAASGGRIRIHRPEMFAIPASLMDGTSPGKAARKLGCPEEWTSVIACWLVSMGAADCGILSPDDAEPDGWVFADKILHARTRGRHVDRYGATFPLRGIVPAPPALPQRRQAERIALAKPDLKQRMAEDPPFAAVMEARRSVRQHSEVPITLSELSEFFYRCGRVKERLEGGGLEYAKRPYPSGGALYEISMYPLVDRCEGLASGLYYYDGLDHCLERVSQPSRYTEEMLEMALQATGTNHRPQLLILLVARFARVFWKYESMAYALVLKNAGVIYQTMYLTATAMGLAASALGGGNGEMFCRAAGTDFWEETSVGEFILGRMGEAGASSNPLSGGRQ
jgi:SagB-type dehydrogenase family enzyme